MVIKIVSLNLISAWLLTVTCMDPDVGSEIVSASERSATPLTLVTLFTGVPSDVVHQSARVGEAPTTDVTLVGFFS